MNTNAVQLDRIIRMGERIAQDGIDAAGMDLLLLAHDARDHGVDDVIITALVDEVAPAVVRERAFARVASALIGGTARTPMLSPAPVLSSPAAAMS